MKRKFYVVMALFSGLIFAAAVYYYFNFMQTPSDIELKPLVVAAQDIPSRTVLQSGQLEIKKVPLNAYPQGGFSSLKDVAGKILLVSLKKGDLLLSPMLEGNSGNSGNSENSGSANHYAFSVPKDKRAVAIPVNLVSSVGYKVKPGDYVDVLITLEVKDEQGDSKTVTTLAAQDVLVLSTGTNAAAENDKAQSSAYILALSVPQSMAVTLGSEKGTIRLLLRNPANKEIYSQIPVDSQVYLDPSYFQKYK